MAMGSDSVLALEKIKQAAQLMERHDVDAWFIMDSLGFDPTLPLMAGGVTHSKCVYCFRRDGSTAALVPWPDMGHVESFGVFDEVIAYTNGLEPAFLELYARVAPKRFALNYSSEDSLWDGLTVGWYRWLERVLGVEELQQKAVPALGVFEELRSIKSPTEIDRLKRAMEITLEVYHKVWSRIRVGQTEKEIHALFQDELKAYSSQGVEPTGSPLVLLPKAGMSHRAATDAVSEPGDLLVIDYYISYKGYHSDIARTFYFLRPGETEPPAEFQRAFRTIREAIQLAVDLSRPGVMGYEVDQAARQHLLDNGYPDIKHSTGHQVGRAVHDGGTSLNKESSPTSRNPLKEGEVYTYEPTILDGLLSMITEEDVYVGSDGPVKLHPWQEEIWCIRQ